MPLKNAAWPISRRSWIRLAVGQLLEEFDGDFRFALDPRNTGRQQRLRDEVALPEMTGSSERLVGEQSPALGLAGEGAHQRDVRECEGPVPCVPMLPRDGDRLVTVGDRLLGMVRFECGEPEEQERHRHRREAGVAGALEARPAQVVAFLDQADPVRGVAGEAEQLRPQFRRQRETMVERGVVPLVGFADAERDVPVDREGSDQVD